MIQYLISLAELQGLLDQEKPGWLVRAGERTAIFAGLGFYDESSSIWSEVKAVYMRLQHGKCAYCERKLESSEYGSIEHDLEHFRPKKKAKSWKLSKVLKKAGVILTQPAAGNDDPGYYLLAYNPQNYCTSCKTCNSRLKSDYFPIAGIRNPGGNDPVQLSAELPLLINPVGDFDDDPETLISFHGLSPMASGKTDYAKWRGLVTITFFHLDDHRRKNLLQERARIIVALHSFLQNAELAAAPEIKEVYESLIDVYTRPSSPHTNCARCFLKVYKSNPDEANELFLLSAAYLKSMSA